MPRVLVVAYHFPPIGGGGVQRNAKFVRYLPEFGYECVVLTGPGRATDRWTPADDTLSDDVPAGTVVNRIEDTEPEISKGVRAALERRLMLETPYAHWWEHGVISTACEIGSDCDLVYGSIVPYETASAVARAAQRLRKPWIADLQDPWALDEMWLYPSEIHRRVDLRRMRALLGRADGVVMNTPEAAERVQAAFPELRSRLVVAIPNGFDPADFDRPTAKRTDGKFRIVHTGYLYADQGLRLRKVGFARRLLGGRYMAVDILTRSHVFLLDGLRTAVRDDPSLAETIEIVLAGVMTETDREIASVAPVTVEMPGYLSHSVTVDLLRSADLLFLPMHDLPSGSRAGLVPGKTYEYLASQRPILAAVPDGDARDLLIEAGNALVCRPADSTAMAEIIAGEVARWRRGEPSPVPRAEVLARYERRRLTEQLVGIFDEILRRS
jgi:glycosyltransferase involved in cell wall biosynthesis